MSSDFEKLTSKEIDNKKGYESIYSTHLRAQTCEAKYIRFGYTSDGKLYNLEIGGEFLNIDYHYFDNEKEYIKTNWDFSFYNIEGKTKLMIFCRHY